jgi:hypothetical protein
LQQPNTFQEETIVKLLSELIDQDPAERQPSGGDAA